MVRSSMAALIRRLRRMVGDQGSAQVFTDEDIQDALDEHRHVARYQQLRAEETRLPGGAVEYRDFYADANDWEADAALVDEDSATLTPAASDLHCGHWSFAAGVEGTVYLSGRRYDLAAAAVSVLEEWAATVKCDVDRALGDEKLSLSQQHKMILAQADRYRDSTSNEEDSGVTVGTMSRADVLY